MFAARVFHKFFQKMGFRIILSFGKSIEIIEDNERIWITIELLTVLVLKLFNQYFYLSDNTIDKQIWRSNYLQQTKK